MVLWENWSKGMWISSLWLAAALLSFATSAFAAANTSGLVTITLRGVGTGAIAAGQCTTPAIPCPSAHLCQCFTGSQTILGNRFNGGSLTFELSVDTTPGSSAVGGLPISTVGSCFGAGGFAVIANTNGMNTLSLDVSGLVCPTVDGSAQTFNGTYVVTQGTNFSGGTGTINGSLVDGTSRSSLNGNIQ